MKKILRAVFMVITVLTLLCYIPNLFIYKISPALFWPMGILGIGFFYCYIALAVCTVASFFLFKKWTAVLSILLIAPIPILQNVYATGDGGEFVQSRQDSNTIRVMQWNCDGFKGTSEYLPGDMRERKIAVDFLQKYQPDIICLQDFGETVGEDIRSNIALIRDSLHYPYFKFNRHFEAERPWGNTRTGIAVFSRFPIVQSGSISYPGKPYPESILWMDIQKGRNTFRVATTHFQSMYLHGNLSKEPLDKCFWADSAVILHGSFIQKLKYFQPYHVTQANELKSFIDTCNKPLVFTGDLNSVPSSYVYKQVRGDMEDAFLEMGHKLGRTYHSWQPALRIDYIFHSPSVENLQTGLFTSSFSDHDPLLMDFQIKSLQ